MACLSNDELAQVASGVPSSDATLHLTGCASCRARLIQRFRASATGDVGDDVTAPSGEQPLPRERLSLDGPRYVTGPDAEVLGRGGYGKVLLSRDALVGRDVALKCLRRRSSATPEQKSNAEERLLREARVAGQLEHPGIVPLYDLGRAEDGSLFYTMRRIRGRTLDEAASSCVDFAARLRLLPNVLATCHAIAYAHSRGVVHRDLKPQNVMVDRFGATVVIDWGLASVRDLPDVEDVATSAVRLVDDAVLTRAHGKLGTPAYMSPEQQTGVRALIDEKSDVWGLGGILFEVLTGQAPRSGEDMDAPPPKVSTLLPECPNDLAALCDKALASARDDRYQSAEALAADLDAWLHGREVTAHSYRPSELLARFVREHRLPLAVASAALLVLVAVGGVAFWRVREERNRARDFGLAMLDDVLPRMTSLGDAKFLSAFTSRVQTWLEATEGAGSVSVGRAWLQLAHSTDDEAESLRFAQRCLAMAGGVTDQLDREALIESCTVLQLRREAQPTLESRLAAYEVLLQRPLSPAARRHPLSLHARAALARAAYWVAERLGRPGGGVRYNTIALELDREALALHPDDLEAREGILSALANESANATNEPNGPRAVALADEAVAKARELLLLVRSQASLERLGYAAAWAVSMHCWYGGPRDELTAALAHETRSMLSVLLLMNPNSARVRAMTLGLLVDLGETSELEQVVAETKPETLTPSDRVAWQYAAVVTGHRRDLLAHPDWADLGGFDTRLAFALAAAAEGDAKRAGEFARKAASSSPATVWSVTGMRAWADHYEGRAADAVKRLVAAMSAGQLANDRDGMSRAVLAFAEELERN